MSDQTGNSMNRLNFQNLQNDTQKTDVHPGFQNELQSVNNKHNDSLKVFNNLTNDLKNQQMESNSTVNSQKNNNNNNNNNNRFMQSTNPPSTSSIEPMYNTINNVKVIDFPYNNNSINLGNTHPNRPLNNQNFGQNLPPNQYNSHHQNSNNFNHNMYNSNYAHASGDHSNIVNNNNSSINQNNNNNNNTMLANGNNNPPRINYNTLVKQNINTGYSNMVRNNNTNNNGMTQTFQANNLVNVNNNALSNPVNSGATFNPDSHEKDSDQQKPFQELLDSDPHWVNPDRALVNEMVSLLDKYFSDENLMKDKFLLKHVRRNKAGYVSVKLLTSFKKLKYLSKTDWKVTAYAIRESKKLELNAAGTKVRRVNPIPEINMPTTSIKMLLIKLPEIDYNLNNTNTSCLSQEMIESNAYKVEKISPKLAGFGPLTSAKIVRPGENLPNELRNHTTKHLELGSRYCAVVEFEKTEDCQVAYRVLSKNIRALKMSKDPNKNISIETSELKRYDPNYSKNKNKDLNNNHTEGQGTANDQHQNGSTKPENDRNESLENLDDELEPEDDDDLENEVENENNGHNTSGQSNHNNSNTNAPPGIKYETQNSVTTNVNENLNHMSSSQITVSQPTNSHDKNGNPIINPHDDTISDSEDEEDDENVQTDEHGRKIYIKLALPDTITLADIEGWQVSLLGSGRNPRRNHKYPKTAMLNGYDMRTGSPNARIRQVSESGSVASNFTSVSGYSAWTGQPQTVQYNGNNYLPKDAMQHNFSQFNQTSSSRNSKISPLAQNQPVDPNQNYYINNQPNFPQPTNNNSNIAINDATSTSNSGTGVNTPTAGSWQNQPANAHQQPPPNYQIKTSNTIQNIAPVSVANASNNPVNMAMGNTTGANNNNNNTITVTTTANNLPPQIGTNSILNTPSININPISNTSAGLNANTSTNYMGILNHPRTRNLSSSQAINSMNLGESPSSLNFSQNGQLVHTGHTPISIQNVIASANQISNRISIVDTNSMNVMAINQNANYMTAGVDSSNYPHSGPSSFNQAGSLNLGTSPDIGYLNKEVQNVGSFSRNSLNIIGQANANNQIRIGNASGGSNIGNLSNTIQVGNNFSGRRTHTISESAMSNCNESEIQSAHQLIATSPPEQLQAMMYDNTSNPGSFDPTGNLIAAAISQVKAKNQNANAIINLPNHNTMNNYNNINLNFLQNQQQQMQNSLNPSQHQNPNNTNNLTENNNNNNNHLNHLHQPHQQHHQMNLINDQMNRISINNSGYGPSSHGMGQPGSFGNNGLGNSIGSPINQHYISRGGDSLPQTGSIPMNLIIQNQNLIGRNFQPNPQNNNDKNYQGPQF